MQQVLNVKLDCTETVDVTADTGNRYNVTIGEFDQGVCLNGEPEILLAVADAINARVPRTNDNRKAA